MLTHHYVTTYAKFLTSCNMNCHSHSLPLHALQLLTPLTSPHTSHFTFDLSTAMWLIGPSRFLLFSPFISLVFSPLTHLFHYLLLFHLASTYHRDISTFVTSLLIENHSFLFVYAFSSSYTLHIIPYFTLFSSTASPITHYQFFSCVISTTW